jgi:hypothetical protein
MSEVLLDTIEEEIIEEVEEETLKPKKKRKKKPSFTNRDSLIKRRFRKGIVHTTTGNVFEIKSLDPKSLLLTRGSAFLPIFNDFIEDPSPSTIAEPEIQDFIHQLVCLGTTSIKFVAKEIEECEEEETPVSVLDIDEQIEIFTAIMELGSSQEEKTLWEFFPTELEEQS